MSAARIAALEAVVASLPACDAIVKEYESFNLGCSALATSECDGKFYCDEHWQGGRDLTYAEALRILAKHT